MLCDDPDVSETVQASARRLRELLCDLAAEHEALDERVSALEAPAWSTPTPATGWSIADEVSHLAYFDESAELALRDRAGVEAHFEELLAALGDEPDVALGRRVGPPALLAAWRAARGAMLAAAEAVAAAEPARVPWYGLEMSLTSFVTARLMETWAHGQDIADALGLAPLVSPRLRHVIHLGVAARTYAFRVHGVEDPGDPVAVRTRNPSDEADVWTFGPPGSVEILTGSALDLALVFTQRRHPSDTGVRAEGATAALFLSVAQAFGGPAGSGRSPMAR